MMIRMIKDYCAANKNLCDIVQFEPMIQFFESVDRLVDIVNGIGFKKGNVRDVELINNSKHRHILELFDVLRLFEIWRLQCKGHPDQLYYIRRMRA